MMDVGLRELIVMIIIVVPMIGVNQLSAVYIPLPKNLVVINVISPPAILKKASSTLKLIVMMKTLVLRTGVMNYMAVFPAPLSAMIPMPVLLTPAIPMLDANTKT